jgi:hypothetical protein
MTSFSALTILPFSVTLIGAAFAIVILNHYYGTRRRPHELIWGIAFILFAVGSATQVLADIHGGWTPVLARLYYLTGAILNVALLGLGTIYLLASRRVANVGLALTLLLAVVSTIVLFTVPVDSTALAQARVVEWRGVFAGERGPAILAAIGSGIGSVLVVGGALWSGITFWRKRIMKSRMIGVFLLAAGTFIVALGGTVKAALNNDHFLYPTMAVGVVVMFVGYLQTIRRAPVPQPGVAQPAANTTTTVG